MFLSFSFNGIKKPYLKIERGRRNSAFVPLVRNFTYIPGMPGAHLSSTDKDIRQITQPFFIEAPTREELETLKEDLAAWLVHDEPKPLIFDDEPNRVYYAVVDGSLDVEKIVNYGRGTITFLCPDPYKYGPEKSVTADSFYVDGTVEAEPIVDVTLNQDVTYVAISDGEQMNIVGNPTKVEQTPYEPESPTFINSASSLTGWTTSSATSVEDSDLTGTLKTNGQYFYTDTYGTSSSWHGPAMKTSLPEALTDFRFDIGIFMQMNAQNQAGGIEVSLLDANSQVIAKMALTKHFGGMSTLYAKIRAGNKTNGYDVLSENQAQFLHTFSGIFRVYRRGNKWTARIYQNKNGAFEEVRGSSWTDVAGIASAAVTQVQVKLIQRATFPVVQQYVTDINVYKLNDPTDGQVPIIARAGDVLTFDHTTDIIRKNGIDFTAEKAFIGEYFSLQPGLNNIYVEPSDAIDNVKVSWRERWK